MLKGHFSKKADVFSLGVTILELATDLDVPKSGDAWHELRSGVLPNDIKHNLSKDLVDIIVKMLNPDDLERPSVDELLQIPVVKVLVDKRNVKMKYLTHISCAHSLYKYFVNFLLTVWRVLMFPIRGQSTTTNQASTPKRLNNITAASTQLLNHIDNDDDDDEEYDGQ